MEHSCKTVPALHEKNKAKGGKGIENDSKGFKDGLYTTRYKVKRLIFQKTARVTHRWVETWMWRQLSGSTWISKKNDGQYQFETNAVAGGLPGIICDDIGDPRTLPRLQTNRFATSGYFYKAFGKKW